jgi:hypothetical protein
MRTLIFKLMLQKTKFKKSQNLNFHHPTMLTFLKYVYLIGILRELHFSIYFQLLLTLNYSKFNPRDPLPYPYYFNIFLFKLNQIIFYHTYNYPEVI